MFLHHRKKKVTVLASKMKNRKGKDKNHKSSEGFKCERKKECYSMRLPDNRRSPRGSTINSSSPPKSSSTTSWKERKGGYRKHERAVGWKFTHLSKRARFAGKWALGPPPLLPFSFFSLVLVEGQSSSLHSPFFFLLIFLVFSHLVPRNLEIFTNRFLEGLVQEGSG